MSREIYFTSLIIFPCLLASCGSTKKSGDANNDQEQHSSTEIWKGSCAEQAETEVSLSLYSKTHWSMSFKGGEKESGTYKLDETAAYFYLRETAFKMMTCEPVEDNVVSCILDDANKISLLNGCNIVKLTYQSGGPGEKNDETEPSIKIPTTDEPKEPEEKKSWRALIFGRFYL